MTTLGNVLATACLVVVLGAGTAIALPGTDSVRSNDLKDGAVRGKDLREEAIKSRDVYNRDIQPEKLRSVPSARIADAQEAGCVAQTISNAGAGESLRFAVEEFDPGGLHPESPACSSPSPRLFAPRAGIYHLGAAVHWPADAGGVRTLSLVVDDETVIATETSPATGSGETLQTVATTARLAFDQRVEAVARQTSGGSLQLVGGADNNYLAMAWIGR
jgi:hypothetical protein